MGTGAAMVLALDERERLFALAAHAGGLVRHPFRRRGQARARGCIHVVHCDEGIEAREYVLEGPGVVGGRS